jgi:hypothetical protein
MPMLGVHKGQQTELGKLSPFLKNTQKSRQLTQSVVAGVMVPRDKYVSS